MCQQELLQEEQILHMRSWQQLVFFYRKAATLLKAVSSVNSAESLWPWRKHPRKKAAAARHSRTYIHRSTYIYMYVELHKQQPLVALAFILIAALHVVLLTHSSTIAVAMYILQYYYYCCYLYYYFKTCCLTRQQFVFQTLVILGYRI